MIHPIPDMFLLPWGMVIEKILRPIAVYMFLIVGLRLAGKRELAQLNPFDFVVLMTLSNTVQNAIIGDDNTVLGGIIGATTLLLINYLVVRALHHHRRLEEIVEGKRDFLIRNGKINHQHLEKELLTRAELVAAAHRQGIQSLAEVDSAVMETTGTITFIQKTPTEDDRRFHEMMDGIEKLRLEIVAMRGEK
ncbi:MAG: YetF domain-containing protein [Tepidisphaeraceae bacterium]|jgi:uncharacterized membrane protein YcaP (DUF421 family)